MNAHEMVEMIRAGEEPSEVMEMALLKGGVPADWTPDKSTPSFKGKTGKDLIKKLADGPMTTKDLASWFHGGTGTAKGYDRVVIHVKSTGYAARTIDGLALTSKGIEYAASNGARASSKANAAAKQADKSAPYTYEPTTGTSSTAGPSVAPAFNSEAVAIKKAREALGDMASDSPLGKRQNIRSHGTPGFKYTDTGGDAAEWTVTINAKKAGIPYKTTTVFAGGRKIQAMDLNATAQRKAAKKVQDAMKKDGIEASGVSVVGTDGDHGDIVLTFKSGQVRGQYGVLTRPKYVVTYDPQTGEPIKTVTAGRGQMTLWPESVQKRVKALQEKLS